MAADQNLWDLVRSESMLEGLATRLAESPYRLTDVASWHSHIPFAFWCVEALRPRVFVELGTHNGDSYCAFCQAVDRLSLPSACYAVDTWKGDPQVGSYGEDVFEEFRRYHDSRYATFSRLFRSTFDEAATHFADGSIDLLHLDGLHTYEAVRHDFETWLPKLSNSGVVLFHDTNVREDDFGVWRLWEELRASHPHFDFLHGHGLGVLLVGKDAPEPARLLAASPPEDVARIRTLFGRLGAMVAETAERRRLCRDLAAGDAQIQKLGCEISRLRDELGRRDVRAAELEQRVETAENEIARSREELRTKEGELRDRLDDSRRAAEEAAMLARDLATRHGQVKRLRQERSQAQETLKQVHEKLKHAQEELKQAHEKLGALHRSWSWRIGHAVISLARLPRQLPHAVAGRILYWVATFQIRTGLRRRKQSSGELIDPPEAAGAARIPEPAAARAMSDALLDTADALLPADGVGDVIVVDRRVPTPDQDSGSVRMFAILKLLRELGHPVTFVSDRVVTQADYEEDVRDLGAEVIHGFPNAVAHLAAEGRRYRFGLLSRPEIVHRYLPAVRAYAIHATVIYDTVDLHWIRLQRAAELTGDRATRQEVERFRRMETLGAVSADLVLAITSLEKDALLAEVPDARVEVVPNIHSCRPTSSPWEDRRDLLFIGGFEHTPNVDAVEWFVECIFPLVRRQLPDVVFQVVGSRVPELLTRLASTSVRIAGYVPDPDDYFDKCRVFVSPLRYGAGLKGKIGQSMSYGLPVVTTSIGAEGMKLVDGENALIADEPGAFAAAVVRLYGDELLWSRIARSSTRHVQENFSATVVKARLASIFSGSHRPSAGEATPGRQRTAQ